MSKTKTIAIFAVLVILAGTLGAAFYVNGGASGQSSRTKQSKARPAGTSRTLAATNAATGSATESAAGGLSVASPSQSDNLGQMLPAGDNPAGTSASKAPPSPFDPTTYSEYEKYKDGTGALFADVVVGEGAELGADMKAAVFYKGWLTNGQLFDASKPDDKGELQPFVFTLGARQVIPGWEQALAGMKVGGVRLVIVPPAVGYGATGQGPVPANAVLIFQVQLAAAQ